LATSEGQTGISAAWKPGVFVDYPISHAEKQKRPGLPERFAV